MASSLSLHVDVEKLRVLNSKITKCALCPRLAKYVRQVGRNKVRRFVDEAYWARPVPSWGDPNARLLIVGLAPAAHGGNRTGRMFTGDSSGDWLARAMHETGFASMPTSRSKDDGLTLKDVYVTAAVRCAPPGNKLLPSELLNCSRYLESELKLLDKVRVVLALGKIGFDAYSRAAGVKGLVFCHGARYDDIDDKVLLASYHPSRQNTNTGKLTWRMWLQVFRTAGAILENDRA
ncbi:MAG: uracil-DNA glycosylase [Thaumarchaeota archaeon]|nr:MAG: uracil-DNA glycosylase [Nitrososphaerota archaeon]